MNTLSNLIVEMYNEVMYQIENNLFEERLNSKESFRKAIALWKNLPEAKKESEAKRILKASKREGYIVKQKEILAFSDETISTMKAKKSVRKDLRSKKKAKREEKFNKIVDTVEDKDLENKTKIELLALAKKKDLRNKNLNSMNREELLQMLKDYQMVDDVFKKVKEQRGQNRKEVDTDELAMVWHKTKLDDLKVGMTVLTPTVHGNIDIGRQSNYRKDTIKKIKNNEIHFDTGIYSPDALILINTKEKKENNTAIDNIETPSNKKDEDLLNVLAVDGSEIVVKGGLKLYKGKPFTGTYMHKNKKGSYISITEVKDGKNHGLSMYFYPNGQKEFEANYMNGLKDGDLIDYDKQGKVKSKEIYKNGKRIK